MKGIQVKDEYKKQLLYSIDKICEKVEGIGYDNGYDAGYYSGYDDGYGEAIMVVAQACIEELD